MNQHGQHHHAQHRAAPHWSRRSRALAGVSAALLVGTAAVAATNWVVGLDNGSSGQGRSHPVSNLTIGATSSPAPGTLLYPGMVGDVVVSITNPNHFPVTVTAVQLPDATTYAAGFTDSDLSQAEVGCTSATSKVTWNYAVTPGLHELTLPVTVAADGEAGNPLVVTLTNAAAMDLTSPQACSDVYFEMPSLVGVAATGGEATPTASPTTTGWTS
jgi:hypothetical protein